MLHGKFFLFDGENKNKYSIIELLFDDASGLLLTDFQDIATDSVEKDLLSLRRQSCVFR